MNKVMVVHNNIAFCNHGRNSSVVEEWKMLKVVFLVESTASLVIFQIKRMVRILMEGITAGQMVPIRLRGFILGIWDLQGGVYPMVEKNRENVKRRQSWL